MLSNAALKQLKPREKAYKVSDRDGLYAHVSTSGAVTFRYDYRLNGRRETVVLGRYRPVGISLATAREKCVGARRAVLEGRSRAQEKRQNRRQQKEARSFGHFGERWLEEARMAESARAMRRAILNGDILPTLKKTSLGRGEVGRRAAALQQGEGPWGTGHGVHVRDIIRQVSAFAILHGEKVKNPTDDVGRSSIATFVPRDRALSPAEIRIMLTLLEQVPTLPTIRLGLRLILLTMVRKSELQDAFWDEVDFENAVWSIPKEHMKRSRPHSVYLSQQALDLLVVLKTCLGNSRCLLPSRYDADVPMSRATFNRMTSSIVRRAGEQRLPLSHFTVHDLRRTGATLLNELGCNRDWLEKRLAHEEGRSTRSVYNKAEYEKQRRHMLQEWADMIDDWSNGINGTPTIFPLEMKLFAAELAN